MAFVNDANLKKSKSWIPASNHTQYSPNINK